MSSDEILNFVLFLIFYALLLTNLVLSLFSYKSNIRVEEELGLVRYFNVSYI